MVHSTAYLPQVDLLRRAGADSGRVVTACALTFEAGGLTERIWDNSDRLRNNRVIALWYLALLTLFSTALVSAVQTGHCDTKGVVRESRRASATC